MDEVTKMAIENRQDQLETEVSQVAEVVDDTKSKVLDHDIRLHELDKRVSLNERDINDINKSMAEIKSDTQFIRRTIVKTIIGAVGTVLATIIIIGLGV